MNELLSNIKGNILLINTTDKYKKIINKNSNIIESFYLDKIKKKKYKSINNSNIKNIKVNKLKKIFNKKSINYTLIDFTDLYNDKSDLIKQSIILTNKDIILYGKLDDYQKEKIIKIYKRYTKDILIRPDYVIIKINDTKYNNPLNLIFKIIDSLDLFIDLLGSGLMN